MTHGALSNCQWQILNHPSRGPRLGHGASPVSARCRVRSDEPFNVRRSTFDIRRPSFGGQRSMVNMKCHDHIQESRTHRRVPAASRTTHYERLTSHPKRCRSSSTLSLMKQGRAHCLPIQDGDRGGIRDGDCHRWGSTDHLQPTTNNRPPPAPPLESQH